MPASSSATSLIRKQSSGDVLSASFEVANTLGPGFLEKVYHRALQRELELRGVEVSANPAFRAHYKDRCVGDFFPDLIVANEVLVEVKCTKEFAPEHFAQCLNDLKVTGLPICLLINFQKPRLEWKRFVL